MTGIGAAAFCVAALTCSGAVQAHPHVWVTTETTVLYDNGTIIGLRQKWSFDEFYTSMALQGLDTNNDGVYDRSELAELAKVNMDGLKEFDYFTVVKLVTEKLKLDAPKDFWLEHADAPDGQTQITVKTGDAAFEGTGAESKDAAPSKPSSSQGFFTRLWNRMFGAPEEGTSKSATAPARPKVLSLHFTLPLSQPVLAEAQGFTFTIADPSFFIAFEPAAKDPVVLGPGAPEGCKIAIGETPAPAPQPDASSGSPAASAPPDGKPPADSNPAADASKLGESFAQQFGEQTVTFGFVRPATISCGPRS
jgi:ABC-type uncharacterized transport system substrate-binding protein